MDNLSDLITMSIRGIWEIRTEFETIQFEKEEGRKMALPPLLVIQ